MGCGFDTAYMDTLLFCDVQINGKGPKSVRGKIISTGTDFLVVQSHHDFTFYRTAGIKQIMVISTAEPAEPGFKEPKVSGLIFEEVNSFSQLISALRGAPVRVNRGGPGQGQGILSGIGPDNITLMSPEGRATYYRFNALECLSITKDEQQLRKSAAPTRPEEHSGSLEFEEIINLFVGSAAHINGEAPGHRDGQILSAAFDYLTICGPDQKITYFPKNKIHNISQMSSTGKERHRRVPRRETFAAGKIEDLNLIRAENFDELFKQLLNKRVHIHLEFSPPAEGTLIAAEENCLVLEEDSRCICYVNKMALQFIALEHERFPPPYFYSSPLIIPKGFDQVSNILKNQTVLLDGLGEDFQIIGSENREIIVLSDGAGGMAYFKADRLGKIRVADYEGDFTFQTSASLTKGETMKNLLETLKGQRVSINFLQPESLIGILFDMFDEFIVLLFYNKAFLVPISEINSLLVRSAE